MEHTLRLETFDVQGKLYKHESKSIVATEKMMMKNSSETVLEKNYIRENYTKDGSVFHVQTHKEEYGKENATLKLNKDMNSLINDISVDTDVRGALKKILNKHEVLDKWEDLKKRWKKEAEKEDRDQIAKNIHTVEQNLEREDFDTEIADQGSLHFLFSGLYRTYQDDEEVCTEKNISKFLVTQPLPLNIFYKVVEFNKLTNEMVIEGTGELAEDRLDKETLNKLIRTLKDSINMKVSIQVDYKERFEFDRYHWLKKADQKIKVKIPGFYMTESEQNIAEIDQYEH